MNHSPLQELSPLGYDRSEPISPQRKHGGGRPRSANSVLDFSERWGISEKSARRLIGRNLSDDALAVLVAESKRYRAAQLHQVSPHGKYSGGMRALGMVSRVPGVLSDEFSSLKITASSPHPIGMYPEYPIPEEKEFSALAYCGRYPERHDSRAWNSPAM